jgi:hypothetical protein
VVFLASSAASLITGHTLLTDGSWTARQCFLLVTITSPRTSVVPLILRRVSKPKDAALTGRYEPFKTTEVFDGTTHNPASLG